LTESEWLDCTDDLNSVLTYLQGKGSMRQWRLFAVASCRRIWEFLPDRESQAAVETAEKFADGAIVQREIVIAQSRVSVTGLHRDFRATLKMRRMALAVEAAKATARPTMWLKTIRAEMRRAIHAVWSVECMGKTVQQILSLRRQFCALTKCVFGQLARPSLYCNPAWFTPTVTSLATAAYEYRARFSGELDTLRLAVLADALEEAGCDNADILSHLRGPGPHVRGCWPVDLLLTKE
jgi:hypothetical protein